GCSGPSSVRRAAPLSAFASVSHFTSRPALELHLRRFLGPWLLRERRLRKRLGSQRAGLRPERHLRMANIVLRHGSCLQNRLQAYSGCGSARGRSDPASSRRPPFATFRAIDACRPAPAADLRAKETGAGEAWRKTRRGPARSGNRSAAEGCLWLLRPLPLGVPKGIDLQSSGEHAQRMRGVQWISLCARTPRTFASVE